MKNYTSQDRHKVEHNLHSFIDMPPIYSGRPNKCINLFKAEKSNIYEFG